MKDPQSASLRREKLLHAKLMAPRLPAGLIARQDLLARLDAGLTRRVILVTAPTGYGKTTLVRQWIADRKIPAAWLTLDEYDNDPVRFWTYLVSALRSVDAGLGKPALSALAAPQPLFFQSVLTALINDLAELQGTCVLVLEDYHTITSAEIHAALSYLLQHLPAQLHVVLISRREPPLPLGVLRARAELVELDAASLRFTAAETDAFLRDALHTPLPADTVAQLQERTEGWAAGLRLAALSLQNRSAAEIEDVIRSFSGSQRFVSDYLIQEVFEDQEKAVQNFLLKTCFLERLTGSLCAAVTGDAEGAAMLARLERSNLFIVQLEHGSGTTWYRYNPLFAESIQYLARQQLSAEDVKSIFEKASDWYEAHGLYAEAIESALSAEAFTRAMALVEKYIEIHDLAELHTLGRWLERIPEREIYLHPEVCFTSAQVILFSSPDRFAPETAARLGPLLTAAEKTWQEQQDHPRLGRLLSLRGLVSWWQGDFPQAFRCAHQSLDELPNHDVFWRGNTLLILGYEALTTGRILDAQDIVLEARALLGAAQNTYGVLAATQLLSAVFYWQGELDQAERLNQQILLEAVGEESMLDDRGIAFASLADIAYERNDLAQAEKYTAQALELAGQRGNEQLRVQASLRQAGIFAARGDFQRARTLLQELVTSLHNPVFLREIQEAQARLSLLAGDMDALLGWQALVSEVKRPVLDLQQEREVFTLARLRIAEGKASQAQELLAGRAEGAAHDGRIRSQVSGLCLTALACFAEADLPQAAKSMLAALAIGKAGGFRRLFLDEGVRLSAALQAVLPLLPNRALSLYATTLLHSFNPESIAPQAASPLVEPLSPQELRVLRLLAAGRSNTAIAQELVISTNTVKTHVKNIYRKLGISSRDEAREVAQELKLL